MQSRRKSDEDASLSASMSGGVQSQHGVSSLYRYHPEAGDEMQVIGSILDKHRVSATQDRSPSILHNTVSPRKKVFTYEAQLHPGPTETSCPVHRPHVPSL